MASEENSWRTHAFRQSVVQKIDEAIQRSGMPTTKNSMEMENHVFQKAKTREEYLGFVARLILHVREMNSKKAGGMAGQGGAGGQAMQDPINALQTLARQGSGNQMMGLPPPQGPPQVTASNLLQTLTQRPVMQQKLQPGMQGGVMGPMGTMPPMPMGPMGPVGMGGPMGNQMGGPMPGQIGSPLGAGQMVGPMPNQMSHMPPQRKGNEGLMMGGQAGPGFIGVRNVAPNQFLRNSPTPPGSSPAGLPTSGGGMVTSPALVPSPNPAMPCPIRTGFGMATSPSSSLNTPGQVGPTPSPCSMHEDQAYREKVRQLSKYIEPLRRMIARMGNNDVEKLSKMKKLLDILANPSQRMPLETLLKCEVVLEKLDLKRNESSTTSVREQHPLLEALSNHLQSPVINHTLQRTFGPCLEALFGSDLKMLPPPLKRKKIEESPDDIPEVLQGEIARLDQRFKVSLDPTQQPGSRCVQLICWLDDRHLPCVPPISLSVPADYPASAPRCHLAPHGYEATRFLQAVQSALGSRVRKLPTRFSVSQLLDTWEMSVRQASAPTQTPISATTVLMAL